MGISITPEILNKIQTKYSNFLKTNFNNKDITEITTNPNKLIFNNKIETHQINDIIKNIFPQQKLKKAPPSKNNDEKEIITNSKNTNNELNKINILDSENDFDDIARMRTIVDRADMVNEIEIKDDEINNIILGRHKSFDLLNNMINENEFQIRKYNNNNKNGIIKQEVDSEGDNNSNDSDYVDISKKYTMINQKNKEITKQNIQNARYKKTNILINFSLEKIRNSYYSKLITKNIWNTMDKKKTLNNIFFFDWDDTLLCTSYLVPTGALNDINISKKDKDIINNLDNLIFQLLSKTVEKGYVFIITNGASGWVELSSKKFYPRTAEILSQVKIISARGLYEKRLPGDMRQWKIRAFKVAIDSLNIRKTIPTNIICFGDSNLEIEASYYLKDNFANAYLKTIKFKENPSHTELEKEIKIIISQLDLILANIKNLSIKVIRKKND